MDPSWKSKKEDRNATASQLNVPALTAPRNDSSSTPTNLHVPRQRRSCLVFANIKDKVKRCLAWRAEPTRQEKEILQDFGLKTQEVATSSLQHLSQSPLNPIVTEPANRSEKHGNVFNEADEAPCVPGEWKLDHEFLMALSAWDMENPQNALTKVLGNINNAIEKAQPFLNLIPDSPFPAQSLVKGLAQILQLSAALSDADRKLYNFAMGVVRWITDLKLQVASFGNEDIAKVLWNNLGKVREIVDMICEWAKCRLADKRWTKLDMDKEIAEFETLVQKARQTFTDSTLITISGNIFLLQNMLEEIQKAHKAQEEAIATERAYSEALNRELKPHVISHPTYDMQGKLPCEPGSRTKVLKETFDWIHDHSAGSQNFLWLTGDPGCGKSAVTANVSQVAKDRRFLWAQFFINRNEEQTTNPNVYFPTIARQLSDNSTKVERHVHDTVMETRSLLDHISPDQAAHLLISAISKASASTPNAPVLVVIDALDETDKARLYDTATIFSNIFDKLSAYPNAKILISSRTEHDVYKPFTSTLTNKHVRQLHLDTRDPSSLADVGRFMRNQLDKIARKHDLDRTTWPGREREAWLVDQAAGLYIWATTVIKFLDERLSKQGRENLYGIIDQLKLPDKADIHVLYLRILQVTYDSSDMDETTKWDLEKCRRIMGAIAVARVQLSVSQLADLLDLRYAPDTDPVDIRNFVQLLRTVLVSGTDDITGETMIQLHKSFFEFITTCSEDRFRVNLEAANAEMALCCLQHLAKSYIIVTNTQFAVRDSDVESLPFSTRYALRFCLSHIPRRPRSDGEMLGVVLANTAKLFPQLNALIPNSVHLLPLSISLQDNPRLVTTSIHTHSLVWNVDNGSPKTPISLNIAPGQLFPVRDGRFFGHRIHKKPDFWSVDAQTFRPVKKFHP
ncbi:hypothetical protein H0H92_004516, partial [Tricholoma furcatifolium]